MSNNPYKQTKNKKYLSDIPELMEDWIQDKNDGLDPTCISSGSHQKILWHCHKCGREWYATVHNRANGTGCTCDAIKRQAEKQRMRFVERDGSLSKTRPEIAAQWHPKLNGDISPEKVTEKSRYKAWWLGEDGVAWQSAVYVRCRTAKGTKRPKELVIKGVNDLQTLRPDLASEWNYDKNKDIDIDFIMPGTKKKVWWICKKGHEWQASVSSRNAGRGCRICNQECSTSFPEQALYFYLKQLFPDAINRYYPENKLEIDIFLPSVNIGIEYDGKYYHSSEHKKKIDEQKNTRLKMLGIRLIRIIEAGGEIPTGTEYVVKCNKVNSKLLIDSAINDLLSVLSKLIENNCNLDVDSERDRTAIMEQYILSEKANSITEIAPEIIDEWHPTKNGKIKPEYIHALSNKQFWWKCKKCGYEWKSPVYRRAKGMGCPVCSGNIVVLGLNDLTTTKPNLAKEWNYLKNDKLKPEDYLAGSSKKVWWKCNKCGYEWEAVIANRSRGNGCPKCAGKIVSEHNSLKFKYPKIASEWAYDLNGEKMPELYHAGSDEIVWWRCERGHTWENAISHRIKNKNCPFCSNKLLLAGFNDFASVHPELLNEWDPNNKIKPTEILGGSNKTVTWICAKGHKWQASISNRIRGNGCPYCKNRRVISGENDLETLFPFLASEWDRIKNEPLLSSEVTPGSNKKVWWKCKNCNGEWLATVCSRVRGRGCPYCANIKMRGL